MCQLRRDFNSSMAEGWQRPLPLQRLRPLLQNEWYKSAPGQTKTQNGKSELAKKFIEKSKLCVVALLLKCVHRGVKGKFNTVPIGYSD